MKRSRSPNFTTAEVMHLLRLVEKYPIVENKKTDGATTKEKQMTWQIIAAKYNSQTKFWPRTAENLLACYKNLKVKAKKMFSIDEIPIKAPMLLKAVEEHGQYWTQVAQATEANSLECQNTSISLLMDTKLEEPLQNKEFYHTVGGPPSLPAYNDTPIIAKTFIGPSPEGPNMTYDGDTDCMKEQPSPIPMDTHVLIEIKNETLSPDRECDNNFYQDQDQNSINNTSSDKKISNAIKRKSVPSMDTFKKGKKTLHMCQSNSFKELSSDKKDLLKSQKILAGCQIQHEQLLIELAKEKLKFEKIKNEMELDFLREKYKLELYILRNKNNMN